MIDDETIWDAGLARPVLRVCASADRAAARITEAIPARLPAPLYLLTGQANKRLPVLGLRANRRVPLLGGTKLTTDFL